MPSGSSTRARLTVYTVGGTRLVGLARPRSAPGDRLGSKPRLPAARPGPLRAARGRSPLKRPRPSFVA